MIFRFSAVADNDGRVLNRIDAMRRELGYALSLYPRQWTGALRRQTLARGIQGSNSIEGYYVSDGDALAAVAGDAPVDAGSETWLAVTGYRSAMTYILQLADDPYFHFNEGTLRGLHYMMLAHDLTKHPGRWRPGSIYVRRDPDGDIVYEGPDQGAVPGLMAEMIADLEAASPLPAMIRAAMAHLNLVMIHPFSDGNGRMGRALQTLVLAREGVLDPRYSSIEEYLGRNTQAYYEVLAAVGGGSWQPARDPQPWIRFCLTAHHRQVETLLRRSRDMARLWDLLDVELRRLGLPERMALGLIDAAFGYGVRNATYRSAAEIGIEMASRDLRALAQAGLLTPRGEKRGRHYVASPALRAMRDQVRERKVVTDPYA